MDAKGEGMTESKGKLLIIADLFFFAKLLEGAKVLGYEATGAGNLEIARRRLEENQFIAALVSMSKPGFDWERFIIEVKSGELAETLPILAFGSHVNVEAFKRAKELGADIVAANSRVASELPYLIGALTDYA